MYVELKIEEMKTVQNGRKIRKYQIGDRQLTADIDMYDGKPYDTRLLIEGGQLCWIAGEDLPKFVEELKKLIDKYRI